MLGYRKAKQLLDIGDIVYIIEGGQIVELKIIRIHKDALAVQDGYLYFDEVGQSWWLTKRGVQDALNKTVAM
jgi:hypothetical protein